MKAAMLQEHAQEREADQDQEEALLTPSDGEERGEAADKGKEETGIKELLASELRGEAVSHLPLQRHAEPHVQSGMPRLSKNKGKKRAALSRRRISEVLLNENEDYLEGYGRNEGAD